MDFIILGSASCCKYQTIYDFYITLTACDNIVLQPLFCSLFVLIDDLGVSVFLATDWSA